MPVSISYNAEVASLNTGISNSPNLSSIVVCTTDKIFNFGILDMPANTNGRLIDLKFSFTWFAGIDN